MSGSSYDQAVDTFLRQFGQTIFVRRGIMNRVWQAFMAYSLCLVAQAFATRGYSVSPQNHSNGFWFKFAPRGDPNHYSYFLAQKDDVSYEIRLSIDCQNLRYHNLRLNLDIAVISPNSIDQNQNHVVDAETNLITFAECKNYRGFPELVATIEGIAFELQRERLWWRPRKIYGIPCVLMVSGSANTITRLNSVYQQRNQSIRIFGDLQPSTNGPQRFLTNWF